MNQHNAKYAFYYLLSLLALVFVSISVGMVSFQLINKYLFDALSTTSDYVSSEALRFAISALIIATPLFYVISSLIRRGIKKGELSLDAPVRRWLTYFILLVSSLVAVGSLIALVNNFLSGEATLRSILKIVTVLVLGAIVFSFYLQEVRGKGAKRLMVRIYFFASLALVLASFVTAILLVDSPKLARAKRLDQNLVNNVYSAESLVNAYYDKYGKLPDTLAALKNEPNFVTSQDQLVDPETKQEIEYQKQGDKQFSLCATFRTDNRLENNKTMSYPSSDFSSHPSGRHCFSGNLWNSVKPGVIVN